MGLDELNIEPWRICDVRYHPPSVADRTDIMIAPQPSAGCIDPEAYVLLT